MIKPKLLFSASLLFLSLIIVLITAMRIAQPNIVSNSLSEKVTLFDSNKNKKNYEATQSALITNLKILDYPLPYPGILPDHPLYWLKMIRDRIVLLLKTNQKDKFSYLLFLANKRLSAGQSLIVNGQKSLGVSTITKAEKYLDQSYQEVKNLDDVEKAKAIQVYLKHREILKLIKNQVEDKEKQIIEDAIVFNQKILELDENNLYQLNIIKIKPSQEATLSPKKILN